MKILIKKENLLAGLQKVQGIVEKRSTAPMLSNVLLEATKDKERGEVLKIEATDLEIGIQSLYPAQIQRKGGIAVSGKKVLEIIRELPEGDIDIDIQEGQFIIIRSVKSFFRITGASPEDFPSLPEIDEEKMLSIEGAVFKDILKKTLYAAADAEPRHVLNGTLFEMIKEGEGQVKVRMVGTDSHRLALCERTIKDTREILDEGKEIKVIIPKKTLTEVKRLLDINEWIDMSISEKQVSFKGDNIFITSRLIEGNYPGYKQVIPGKGESVASFKREALINVVKRVSVLSREKTRAILIELLPEKAIFSARDPEIGEAREEMEIRYGGSTMTIGLNYRYLLDSLGSFEDEYINMEFSGSLKPVVIKEESDPTSLSLIMPMRVQDIE